MKKENYVPEGPIIIISNTFKKIKSSTWYTTNWSIKAIGYTLINISSIKTFITLIEWNKALNNCDEIIILYEEEYN